jgi:hypothetical protein
MPLVLLYNLGLKLAHISGCFALLCNYNSCGLGLLACGLACGLLTLYFAPFKIELGSLQVQQHFQLPIEPMNVGNRLESETAKCV